MLVNLIDFDMPVQQAIEAPRFALDAKPNFYKTGAEITVQIENRVSPETIAALKAMGHKVIPAVQRGLRAPCVHADLFFSASMPALASKRCSTSQQTDAQTNPMIQPPRTSVG